MSRLRTIKTVDEVLVALGPRDVDVQRRFGLRSSKVVGKWRDRQKIPARFFVAMDAALKRHGLLADPSVWGQEELVDA